MFKIDSTLQNDSAKFLQQVINIICNNNIEQCNLIIIIVLQGVFNLMLNDYILFITRTYFSYWVLILDDIIYYVTFYTKLYDYQVIMGTQVMIVDVMFVVLQYYILKLYFVADRMEIELSLFYLLNLYVIYYMIYGLWIMICTNFRELLMFLFGNLFIYNG